MPPGSDRCPWQARLMARTGVYQFTQERIVFSLTVVLFVGFSIGLPGFFSAGNLLSLVQNVAILGILGLAMGLVIIGRGIDLAIVAIMVTSVGWVLYMGNHGTLIGLAVLKGLGYVLAVGFISGVTIAYVEIPAIFATLAIATALVGFSRLALIDLDVVFLPPNVGWLTALGHGDVLDVPMPVILFAAIALLVALFLRYTTLGRYLRAIGDNPLRSRIAGIPVRPVTVLLYLISAVIAYAAGLITAMLVSSMNTRLANSTMVYDVILVVVLGGIGLSGGKGGVRNVIVGTLMIGTLLNGMTILDVPYTLQNLIKGLILLVAIIVDSYVNPRDEQTSQQGDI